MGRLRFLTSRAAFSAVIACAVLAPLAVHWLAGRTLVWFDTQNEFAPLRWMIEQALRSFRLPLWNPFAGAGMPLLADTIHGVLHPVSILTAWLRTERSADVLIGGYVTCAGAGAALLARDLGASRPAAAAAAVAYGASGFVLSMTGYLNLLAGAGSLPFCVAGLRRSAAEARPAHLVLGVGGAAVLALSGDPQALMVSGPLALALSWEKGGWRGAARAVAAGSVGLLIAGVQLVPSAVNVAQTVRDAGLWRSARLVWALAPWRIPELVVPGLFRSAEPYVDPVFAALAGPGRWPEWNPPFPFATSVFMGVVPLTLAIAGVREGRRGRLLGLLALGLFWIALGPTLGADSVLGHVPVWRAFQYPEKLVGPLTLVLAVLAGLGFDAVVERRVPGWQVFTAAAALGMGAIGACQLRVSTLVPDVASMAEARVLRGAWHVLGAVLALGGWVLLRDRVAPSAASAGLAVLAFGGMAAASPLALHPGDPAARLRSPGPALDAKAPGPRIVTPYMPFAEKGNGARDRLDEAGRTQAALGYPAYNVRFRLDSLTEYSAMTPRRLALVSAMFGPRWPLAARRYAVTHLVLDPPSNEAQRNLYAVATTGAKRIDTAPGPYEVWAVPHREWATFAPGVLLAENERAAVPATVRVFLEQGASVVIESPRPFAVGPGHVLSVARELESLRVEAEADTDATLVIADAWWPGWEATIDGREVTIYRADSLVRAVRWPAGRHVLEMHYRPREALSGIFLSALGVAVLAAWIAHLRRDDGRRQFGGR